MSKKDKKKAEATESPAVEPDKDALEIETVEEVLLQPRVPTSKFALRFSPYAWTKLRWIRDYCNSEIAGFGISSMADPFYMEDFRTIKQVASSGHFQFDDDALNDYLADMFEEGKQPGECMRLWLHTHPTKNFASPSGTDEQTFSAAFGNADWAMMIIVDEGDNVYARLRIKSGADGCLQMIVPSSLDYQPPFKGVEETSAGEWKQEADANITQETPRHTVTGGGRQTLPTHCGRRHHYKEYIEPYLRGFDSYDDSYMAHARGAGKAKVDEWEDADMLIMGEERVIDITTDKKSQGVLVLLNNAWLIYSADVTPICKSGAIITSAKEVAEVPPLRCGELDWNTDQKTGETTPSYSSEVVDGFIQYFDDDSDRDDEVRSAAVDAALDEAEDIEIETVGEVLVGPSGP